MKKAILPILLSTFLVAEEPTILPESATPLPAIAIEEAVPLATPPVPSATAEMPAPPLVYPNHFNYLSIGAAMPMHYQMVILASPDIFFGERLFLQPRHALDFGFGASLNLAMQLVYAQGSYLHYFTPNQGLYLGLGVTLGVFHLANDEASWLLPGFGPWINVPISLGYQFPSSKNQKRFIQLQVTPLLTGTISYGFGY